MVKLTVKKKYKQLFLYFQFGGIRTINIDGCWAACKKDNDTTLLIRIKV